jgi:uncharacterized membrane protein YfcA
MEYVAAVLLGYAGGVVGGMLGVGGGILFVPALAIFLDEPQLRAEATSLLAIVPVAIAGTWRQYRFGNVRLGDGIAIGLLSPVGVLAGVVLANAVSERTLEVAFAILIIFVAAQLARRGLRAPSTGG